MRRAWGLWAMMWVACLGIARGQAVYAGNGPGSLISVGVTASGYQSAYGQMLLGGGTVFIDANPYRKWGTEVEARTLRFHTDEDMRESSLLAGPKLSSHGRTWRPYAKLLVGRGWFQFPFRYAQGGYFVVAPGAGLDWRVGHSRLMVRVIDFEYQDWPGFTFGPMRPYGASAGLSWRVF